MRRLKPSIEDVLELSGIEVLHPGGLELSRRIGEIVNMKNKSVLDVSCGRGLFACFYAKKFKAKITGIDISPEMIESSLKRAQAEGVQNVTTFQVADALSLPFPANTFDVVVNECSVGLTGDPQKCLNEMVRVAKPGGKVIFHESVWLKELTEEEKKDFSTRLGTVPFSLQEWQTMLTNAGAVNIYYEDWSGPENIARIRIDRKIKSPDDLFSLREKLTIIFPRVLARYGIQGLLYLNQSQRKIAPLYSRKILGYYLFKAEKPART